MINWEKNKVQINQRWKELLFAAVLLYVYMINEDITVKESNIFVIFYPSALDVKLLRSYSKMRLID